MKKQIKLARIMALTLSLTGLMASSSGVNAAEPYGMDYSGGAPLSADNLQINPTLTEELSQIIMNGGDSEIIYSNSSLWKDGYYSPYKDMCFKSKYLRIDGNDLIGENDNVLYTIKNNKYYANVKINDVVIEGLDDLLQGGNGIAVAINSISGGLAVRYQVYSDEKCEEPIENMKIARYPLGGMVYVDTNIKLYETESNKLFTSNQLYFGLTDIDAGQSYKIMNQNNLMTPSNMYALSVESLTPSDEAITLRNMYVASGNYIYSQTNLETGPFDIDSGSNLFVKTVTDAQREGLNVIFGYSAPATSSVRYYAKQYVVKYISDKNGEVTGIESESVVAGHYPSGSITKPADDYEFEYWIADEDVVLTDGTKIKAGEKMTLAQVKEVVVDKDITFKAIHDTIPIAVPNTGEMTSDGNGGNVVINIALPLSVVLMILGVYAYQRKKSQVKF